eukprot:TRINITY_DN3293_c0_g1_i1.p2 TRINITY_DN3293_c0_g1~~TRINITY_DN3293_c0_g1_i1.p2  ORF type:complete len:113 (+),score=9.79 TRINITY_DN3293_c0_g1_i1:589-927(+)
MTQYVQQKWISMMKRTARSWVLLANQFVCTPVLTLTLLGAVQGGKAAGALAKPLAIGLLSPSTARETTYRPGIILCVGYIRAGRLCGATDEPRVKFSIIWKRGSDRDIPRPH